MRLGTRWAFGGQPPAAVPREMRDALDEAELAVGSSGAGSSWTLTWLEGRPIAELDDGTTVSLGPGATHIARDTGEDAHDEW